MLRGCLKQKLHKPSEIGLSFKQGGRNEWWEV